VTIAPRLTVAELDELLFEKGACVLANLIGMDRVPVSSNPPIRPRILYESFPDRRTVAGARSRGVRLWRLSHAVGLLMRLFGWRRA
jgi:hypothetical protein